MDLEYRKRLAYIDDGLHKTDCKIFKFLCEPLIGRSVKDDSPMSIFEALEGRRMLSASNMTVISEALQIIQRYDLLEDIRTDSATTYHGPMVQTSMICPFRATLAEISENLPDEDLNRLRFIYNKVPKKTKIGDGIDLFKFMMQRGDLKPSSLTALTDIFSSIERTDLVNSLQSFQDQHVQRGQYMWQARQALTQAQEETYDDRPPTVESMYDEPENASTGEPVVTRAELLPPICTSGATSSWETNCNVLGLNTPHSPMTSLNFPQPGPGECSEQLKPSGYQNSVLRLLSEIQHSGNYNNSANLNSAQQSSSETGIRFEGEHVTESTVPVTGSSEPLLESSQEADPPLNELGVSLLNIDDAAVGATASTGVPEGYKPVGNYKMEADPRGLCVIVDIENFTHDPHDPQAKKLNPREGSKYDREALTQTFSRLLFKVEVVENPNDRDLLKYLEQVSKRDHSYFDCFVACILTHGGNGFVYGSNGRRVYLEQVTSYFRGTNCPSLLEKPKLFFLGCCQGTSTQQAVELLCDIEADGPGRNMRFLPDEADFLIGYATVQDYVSYRSRSQGTWYITELTKILDKYAEIDDLNSILLRVNAAVAEYAHEKTETNGNTKLLKQVPAPQTTLRFALKFL
ncbi:caspase-8 [Aplysia californica]|uniref:Caspase-8 n=1 Tax=Aplysia californica TaxID=6500 RepID=A0ABM1ACU1_APLCA|nr:caspase-8 [Aplysia californica]